jgi:20S proteasome alpha/beta subunit
VTIITWDGETLAADKRAVNVGLIRTITKIFKTRDCLVGYSGTAAYGQQMLQWFEEGEKSETFPEAQRIEDTWVSFLVIRPGGKVEVYEKTPVPVCFEDKHFATGSGRDYAIMAMHLGKSAHEAVQLTELFENGCGSGITVLTL